MRAFKKEIDKKKGKGKDESINTANKYAQVGLINQYAFYLTMNSDTFIWKKQTNKQTNDERNETKRKEDQEYFENNIRLETKSSRILCPKLTVKYDRTWFPT